MAEAVSLDARARAFAPWVFLLAAPVAVLVGVRWGAGVGVLVAASVTLAGALFLVYKSLVALVQGLGTSAAEVEIADDDVARLEAEKDAVLRALKDLEYERAVGKIAEEDFESLTKQYRARAVEILARIDRDLDPYRKKAERAIEERLAKVDIAAPVKAAPAEVDRTCPECDTRNDADSVFCKKCGHKLARS